MGRFAHGPFDIAGKRCPSDGFSLPPRILRGPPVERTVANERELAGAGARTLIDHSANRFRKCGVAETIKNDLRDRTASLKRFEAGFVVNSLAKAQQRALLIDAASADIERLGGMKRTAREGQRGIDQLRLVSDGLHVIGGGAGRRLDQRRLDGSRHGNGHSRRGRGLLDRHNGNGCGSGRRQRRGANGECVTPSHACCAF
jgi:hypothetical protein